MITFKRSSAWAVVSPPFWTNVQNTVLYRLLMWPKETETQADIFYTSQFNKQMAGVWDVQQREYSLHLQSACLQLR